VEEVFPKKSKDEGISLSTIHKAKGLEANNVFIICPSLMPSKSAKQEWEITQEKNLIYVAYTRAKNKLAFVDENGFESFFNDNAGKTEKILDRIEEKVNLTLGKTKKAIINESTARTIIHNATTIRLPQPKTRIIDISNKKEEKTFSNIGMKKKITKRKR
jgi:ATP-dependent exoDNAse (exonuclease V) beta subunit